MTSGNRISFSRLVQETRNSVLEAKEKGGLSIISRYERDITMKNFSVGISEKLIKEFFIA